MPCACQNSAWIHGRTIWLATLREGPLSVECFVVTLIILLVVSSAFIWLWNACLEDFFRILLPPRDMDPDGKFEDCFKAFQTACGRKRRRQKR